MGRFRAAAGFDLLPKDGEVFSFQAPTIADTLDVIALADAGRLRDRRRALPARAGGGGLRRLDAGELTGRAVVTPS